MENQVQLITYADRLGGEDLKMLDALLTGPLSGLFGGIHILPFYDPIDGADAGFDPVDHARVDPRLGDWGDVAKIAAHTPVMADLIVNHCAAGSAQFQDVLEKGDASPHAELFLTFEAVFPDGAREGEIAQIYRPRPNLPFTPINLADGTKRLFWTTFTAEQIDINVESAAGQAYLTRILDAFAEGGVTMIRLDAAGYAIKRAGTSCFMLPETYEFIGQLRDAAKMRGMEVLVEIHSYYQTQIEIAAKCDRVYDFALPPLVLHALFQSDATPLGDWLRVAPRNCITVLDTHDGIGIIDAGPEGDKPGLLSDAAVENLVETIHEKSSGESRQATGAAASNLDLYQVNCTYYDALGKDDLAYLIARAIQFFCPGVPQVYYTGLLAEPNDMALLAETGVGRDINRHFFKAGEAAEATARPVVQALFTLIRFRNRHAAFNGAFELVKAEGAALCLSWQNGKDAATLTVDLAARTAVIEATGEAEPLDIAQLI